MKINFSRIGSWLSLAVTLAPALVLADNLPSSPITSLTGQGGIFGPSGIVCSILNLLFGILIVAAIFFVLLSAFKYLTAGGDAEKVKAAANELLYAAIAVAVALIAKGIPLIVGSFIGGSSGITGNAYGC